MYDAYLNPKGALCSVAAALEAVQFITLDPENTSLAHEPIAWALETAARTSATQRNPPEGKNV